MFWNLRHSVESNEAAEWSPDGSQMAHYSSRGGQNSIFLSMLSDRGNEIRLHSSDQLSLTTSFAPDGKSLVVVDGLDLWRIPTDGSAAKNRW